MSNLTEFQRSRLVGAHYTRYTPQDIINALRQHRHGTAIKALAEQAISCGLPNPMESGTASKPDTEIYIEELSRMAAALSVFGVNDSTIHF
jgi:hypothetical protein